MSKWDHTELTLFSILRRMATDDTQRGAIIADMLWKVSRRDWHGVSDAACDLRELEAEERGALNYAAMSAEERLSKFRL
jgi:hypothetical protein